MSESSEQSRLQLIVSLCKSSEFASAIAEAHAITDKVIAAQAFREIARINANTQRFAAALEAIDFALGRTPDSREIRLERAILAGRLGDEGGALTQLESLVRESLDHPQYSAELARAQLFAGRARDAEASIMNALRLWPTDATLHRVLAQARWRRGCGDQSTALLEQAIEDHPAELKLRLVAADLLRNAGHAARALELLEAGLRRAPGSAAFSTSVGVLLEGMDRPQDALPYLQAAAQQSPGSLQAKRNLVPTLLRLGETGAALALCADLEAQLPDDQQTIAYRATALRLRQDPDYRWLHDYERLVRVYRPAPPPGFANIGEFNAAFARELLSLHVATQRPLDQSLRGGTQTERNLPAANPVVAGFFAMIDAPIRDYIARLHDADDRHPVDRRRSTQYRLTGSWSVQLQPGGFHVNHVHPQGWLSSAYYVALPASPESGGAREGWLKFGEPAFALPACPPNYFVEPEPGMLVLFPSYLWHGTVPFESGGRRLTAAFDVVPA